MAAGVAVTSRTLFAQAAAGQASAAPVRPGPSEFAFARLRYDSGDWDYNPKVAANVLDAVVQYTEIPVYPNEVVIAADSVELPSFPFIFMTGHTLVRFSTAERENLIRYVDAGGGLLFSDDCNHDVNGLYAKSFEEEMRRTFPGADTLAKIPEQPSPLPLVLQVRRTTADHARAERLGRQRRPRLSARRRAPWPPGRHLLQQGLRLRVGLRLAQQALPHGRQHALFGQPRRLCDDVEGGLKS